MHRKPSASHPVSQTINVLDHDRRPQTVDLASVLRRPSNLRPSFSETSGYSSRCAMLLVVRSQPSRPFLENVGHMFVKKMDRDPRGSAEIRVNQILISYLVPN